MPSSKKKKSNHCVNRELPKYVGPKPNSRLMTKQEIKFRFDNETASAYSQQDPAYLPDYADSFELLVDCVAPEKRAGMAVLDFGAGTGNLSLRLLRRDKECHVTLVDFSENMLHEVPKVLGEYRNRFNIVCHDFFSVKFKKGSFDAIISSFAVHHTRSIEGYVKLYRRIRGWLRPGGIFACIDVVSGANPAWTEINENGWRKYLTGFFGKAKIDRIFANYRAEDSPISLPEHIFCLNKAGFSQTDILWKRYNFALYCGMK